MIGSTSLKNGVTFLSNETPYKVVKYSLIKMGRGGAVVRVTAKNLLTGTTEDKTFSSNVKVDEAKVVKRRLQLLYSDAINVCFMDPITYKQVEIPVKKIAKEITFIKEGGNVDILFWSFGGAQDKEDVPLGIDIPPKVDLKVLDTPPGVKGNSASNVFKDAVLENGLRTKVPLFINNGDLIIVDTRTGEYSERAK